MEKSKPTTSLDLEMGDKIEAGAVETTVSSGPVSNIVRKLATVGVEIRGLEPIPIEQRTHTKYYNIFTFFGGSFLSILPEISLSIGTTPTLVFGLSFKDTAIMVVTMQFLFILPTLYILSLAPLLGMRQSVQFRYVFGKYPNIVISVIVLLVALIFGILATVAGAECLSAVRPGTLPMEASITIILAVGFIISFIGYRALHLVCQYIWIPTGISILILVGCGGSKLSNQAPATSSGAAPYLATLSICASNMATWGMLIGDYACYMPPTAPRRRLALYCLAGLYVPFTLMMLLGAAVGGAIPATPSWTTAYSSGGLGAVLGEILVARVGNFGKFILVILGFSIVTTSARDMYSISLFTVGVVPALAHVPRIVLLCCAAGVMVGLAIAASQSFLSTLSTLVSIAGYMTGPTVCVYLVEWVYFRKADPASFDPAIWNDAKALPSGVPALFCSVAPWALIITSMSTSWYEGPIARNVGDLAYELGARTVYPRGLAQRVADRPFQAIPVTTSAWTRCAARSEAAEPPSNNSRDTNRYVSPSLSEVAMHQHGEHEAKHVVYMGDSANFKYVLHELGDPFNGSKQQRFWGDHLQRSLHERLNASTRAAIESTKLAEEKQMRDAAVFDTPSPKISDTLIHTFRRYSYPVFPIFHWEDFVSKLDSHTVSPLLLNAVYLMGTFHCPESVLHEAGFNSRYLAGLIFYRRAKALYDADREFDSITALQATILLSNWWAGPMEQKDTWKSYTLLPVRTQMLWRRIWWIHDMHYAAILGRPPHIHPSFCDVNTLEEGDFDRYVDADAGSSHEETSSESIFYLIHFSELISIAGDCLITKLSSTDGNTVINKAPYDRLLSWQEGLPSEFQNVPSQITRNTGFWPALLHLSLYEYKIVFYRMMTDKPQTVGLGSPLSECASRITRILEDLLASGTLYYAPFIVLPAVFASTLVHIMNIHKGDPDMRVVSEHRANLAMHILKRFEDIWPMAIWTRHLLSGFLTGPTMSTEQSQPAVGGGATDVPLLSPISNSRPAAGVSASGSMEMGLGSISGLSPPRTEDENVFSTEMLGVDQLSGMPISFPFTNLFDDVGFDHEVLWGGEP
ncbi:hypothetical protein FE257_000070 [Aspergillus nanangensis]|uniref:Xylanolytic transcriptional activator regulatory domain-containing protein n=1 Tax=Aspergillus nanangensis TaxID=2582783 RepID=A0AAD4H0X6_ASPNN|nr:hypothetical protein FE257_000070 [Aspergillus nanangensis]